MTGTLQQGKKLTATTGTWLGTRTITYAFQWYRCDPNVAHCSSIHGATKNTYTLVANDVGHTMALTVRATDSTGTTSGYAPAVGLVAAAAAKVTATAQPPLAGDPIVGASLTVQGAAASAGYAWLRCNANGRGCAAIAGETAGTYKLSADDVGHTIVATVTASKQTVLSSRSGVVRQSPGPVLTVGPTATGTLQQGKKLTAFPGTWRSGGAVTYAFQWYRCDARAAHCSSVHGATKATYTEVAKDVGHTIGLTVRATDSTGTTPAYASVAGVVAAVGAVAATSQPGLDGTAAIGSTLKAQAATWTTTLAGVKYAWLRCNANGRACVAIPNETTDSYEPTSADSGHRLVATETAGATTVLSLASAVVA